MERTAVKSNAVTSIGHDGDTLHVEYRSGHVYAYHGITRDEHEALLGATSIGTHLHSLLREKNVKGTRVQPEPETVSSAQGDGY